MCMNLVTFPAKCKSIQIDYVVDSACQSLSTSPFRASAGRPVRSSSLTRSSHSSSPSHSCQSSFDRALTSAPVSGGSSGEFSTGTLGERGKSGAGGERWRRAESTLRERGGGDMLARGTPASVSEPVKLGG